MDSIDQRLHRRSLADIDAKVEFLKANKVSQSPFPSSPTATTDSATGHKYVGVGGHFNYTLDSEEEFDPTFWVNAYVNSTVFTYEFGFRRKKGVMSTGLVDPGLFFRPRRFALTSPPLTFSSDW